MPDSPSPSTYDRWRSIVVLRRLRFMISHEQKRMHLKWEKKIVLCPRIDSNIFPRRSKEQKDTKSSQLQCKQL